jgi:hypothetical protein
MEMMVSGVSVETEVRSNLCPGTVYYFKETLLNSPEPHYFIVININPITDRALILVCSSSKVNERKQMRRMFPGTLIEISPVQYTEFDKNSIVDCNQIFEKSITEIIQKKCCGELKIKPVVDYSIVEELREAVIASPQVEQEIIDMLI